MRTLRSLFLIGMLATLVAGCRATEERAERTVEPRSQTQVSTPPVSAPPAAAVSRSPLAGRVVELDSAAYEPREHRARTEVPRKLQIDDLEIDAPVQAVGVASDGTMEIPGPTDVGWYRFGAAPNEEGAIVLAGHIAFNGVDGAFRKLSELDPGTRVEVEMNDGSLRAYQVLQVDRYRKESLPAETWTKSGPERLVLITCGGSFDEERRRYDSNVVATATPIRDQ